MQSNVVQSPQVASAQTSIVQSQTATLPTNEQTESIPPSQEPFAVCIVICYVIFFGKMCM